MNKILKTWLIIVLSVSLILAALLLLAGVLHISPAYAASFKTFFMVNELRPFKEILHISIKIWLLANTASLIICLATIKR